MKKRALGVQIAAWRNGLQETQTSLEINCIIEPPAAVCVRDRDREEREDTHGPKCQNSGSGSYLGPTEELELCSAPTPAGR